MRHFVFVAALAAELVSPIRANATMTAVWLYAACSRGAVVPDGPIPDQVMKALPPNALSDNNLYLNYFRAIVETHALISEHPLCCLQPQFDLPLVVRHYLRARSGYKRLHDMPTPADMQDPNAVAATADVLNFLRGAYPCTGRAR